MSTGRQRRPSQRPCLLAQGQHIDHAVPVQLEGRRDGPQTVQFLRNMSVLDGHPLRDLHPGQAGGLLDRYTEFIAAALDEQTEEAAPDLAAQFRDIGGRQGRKALRT